MYPARVCQYSDARTERAGWGSQIQIANYSKGMCSVVVNKEAIRGWIEDAGVPCELPAFQGALAALTFVVEVDPEAAEMIAPIFSSSSFKVCVDE